MVFGHQVRRVPGVELLSLRTIGRPNHRRPQPFLRLQMVVVEFKLDQLLRHRHRSLRPLPRRAMEEDVLAEILGFDEAERAVVTDKPDTTDPTLRDPKRAAFIGFGFVSSHTPNLTRPRRRRQGYRSRNRRIRWWRGGSDGATGPPRQQRSSRPSRAKRARTRSRSPREVGRWSTPNGRQSIGREPDDAAPTPPNAASAPRRKSLAPSPPRRTRWRCGSR